MEKRFIERAPYFVVEDDEGRRARVFFNSRLLSEWYWAQDRLASGDEVVVRGTLQLFTPNQLRELAGEGEVWAADGVADASLEELREINRGRRKIGPTARAS